MYLHALNRWKRYILQKPLNKIIGRGTAHKSKYDFTKWQQEATENEGYPDNCFSA
jgi:hypothetical protein